MPRSAHVRGRARLRVWNGPRASTTTAGFCAMIWVIAAGRDMLTARNRARSAPITRTVLPAATALRPATITSIAPVRARLAAMRRPNTPYPPRISTTGSDTQSVYRKHFFQNHSYGNPCSSDRRGTIFRICLNFPQRIGLHGVKPSEGVHINAGPDHGAFAVFPCIHSQRLDPEDLHLPGQGHFSCAQLEWAAQRYEERGADRR